jgi:large conductance mechanosensitive channel
MSLVSEFKAFIMRGNVVDLAVGVVIGAAFSKIVEALVAGIFMPIIGLLTPSTDFNHITLTIHGESKLGVGMVIQAIFHFVIIGACLFSVVKVMNAMKKKDDDKPAEPSAAEKLLAEIRDELKKRPV